MVIGNFCGDNICTQGETCETCPEDCGECVLEPECEIDFDCGESYFVGDNYCFEGNVVRDKNIPRCIERNCEIQQIVGELVEICDNGCENKICIGEEPEQVHDVALDDLKITDSSGDLIEGDIPQLHKDESYKILIDLINIGTFTENVSFKGEIKSGGDIVKTFKHLSVKNLEPEEIKNDKKRTVKFNIDKGFYEISVEAIIESEDVPENNLISMIIEVV